MLLGGGRNSDGGGAESRGEEEEMEALLAAREEVPDEDELNPTKSIIKNSRCRNRTSQLVGCTSWKL